jgi:hypothetical protein
MAALRALGGDSANLATRLVRGYNERECAPPGIVTECWENLYGRIAYVTAERFRIDSICITRGTAAGWSQFTTNPEDYLRATRLAALKATASGSQGCYRALNRERSEDLATFIQDRRPLITCSPTTAATAEDSECAHASRGSPEIVLTRPNNCGDLAKTLFHELMHTQGHVDNLATRNHNDPSCRPYDGIYACGEICFPSTPRVRLHQSGCYACSPDNDTRCGGLSNAVDDTFLRCGGSLR